MALTCLLIRHASAELSLDIPEPDWALTSQGERQARDLAAQLAAAWPGLRAVYCSPFRRAQQTARPLAAALGLPLQVVEDLRERHVQATLIEPHDALSKIGRLRYAMRWHKTGSSPTTNWLVTWLGSTA